MDADNNLNIEEKNETVEEPTTTEIVDEVEKISPQKAEAIIEAILFTMGESVELYKLAEVLGMEKKEAKKLMEELMLKYDADNRGIRIIELDGAYQMCTRGDLYEYLIKIAKAPKRYALTDTVLETLSIIAYKQPVTKADIERIRGVSCDFAVNKLIEYDLVAELGRLDAPGRPLLFGTTEEFLRSFGVKSLEDLPELSTTQIEDFRIQAEEEAQMDLDI